MWHESRRILALIGDQRVTIAAFFGLLLYGSALLASRSAQSARVRALLITGGAALWLLAAMIAIIPGDLASWSSFAVFLFVIGIEGRTSARPARKPRSSGEHRPGTDMGQGPSSSDDGSTDAADCSKPPFVAAEPAFGQSVSN